MGTERSLTVEHLRRLESEEGEKMSKRIADQLLVSAALSRETSAFGEQAR